MFFYINIADRQNRLCFILRAATKKDLSLRLLSLLADMIIDLYSGGTVV